MARYTGPVCRICRRQGTKLFLKGTKCLTEKCPVQRRAYPPGQHGQGRIKLSDYGIQLREKQKVKRMYGLMEKQFRKTFAQASRAKGVTGEKLLELLERRLDNAVFRLGFATSRSQARQIVLHGHVRVAERRVTIPSFLVRPGQSIRLFGSEKFLSGLKQTRELTKERPLPPWLDRHPEEPAGSVIGIPQRGDVQFPIQESLIVELYSK
ncbi:MAG: 30S ribosomal protein S4 [Candidatus Omnitrophica bacterium]|nr:30S ribosomal protein S4 [Candidatus Omnitrophota bacterium]